MKGPLSFLLFLGIASGRALVVRDQKTVTDVLSSVQSAIDKLDAAAQTCCSDLQGLLSASNGLDAAIKDGTATISSSSDLTLIETIKIIKPVQSVQAHATTLVNDLKGKKSAIVSAGLCGVFEQQIGTITTDSQALVNTTVSKVPQIAQDVARKVAQGILDELTDASQAFSAENCH